MPGRPWSKSALKTCSAVRTLDRQVLSWSSPSEVSVVGVQERRRHQLTRRELKAYLSGISMVNIKIMSTGSECEQATNVNRQWNQDQAINQNQFSMEKMMAYPSPVASPTTEHSPTSTSRKKFSSSTRCSTPTNAMLNAIRARIVGSFLSSISLDGYGRLRFFFIITKINCSRIITSMMSARTKIEKAVPISPRQNLMVEFPLKVISRLERQISSRATLLNMMNTHSLTLWIVQTLLVPPPEGWSLQQYQQKWCPQGQVMWGQPEIFSMGISHLGHLLESRRQNRANMFLKERALLGARGMSHLGQLNTLSGWFHLHFSPTYTKSQLSEGHFSMSLVNDEYFVNKASSILRACSFFSEFRHSTTSMEPPSLKGDSTLSPTRQVMRLTVLRM